MINKCSDSLPIVNDNRQVGLQKTVDKDKILKSIADKVNKLEKSLSKKF
jgi:hypothetical protein